MREFVLFTILSQSLMMTNSKDHLQQPQPNRIGGLYDITMIQWNFSYGKQINIWRPIVGYIGLTMM